jgi:hypothetical protein
MRQQKDRQNFLSSLDRTQQEQVEPPNRAQK